VALLVLLLWHRLFLCDWAGCLLGVGPGSGWSLGCGLEACGPGALVSGVGCVLCSALVYAQVTLALGIYRSAFGDH
jgi:hypothetical protein